MKDEKLLKCERIEFLICKKKRVSMAVFQDSDTIYKDVCKSLVFLTQSTLNHERHCRKYC